MRIFKGSVFTFLFVVFYVHVVFAQQVNYTVTVTEVQWFDSFACFEFGNEEYSALVSFDDNIDGTDVGGTCFQCNNNGNCTINPNSDLGTRNNTCAETINLIFEGWENDSNPRCTENGGDDCGCGPSTVASVNFRNNPPGCTTYGYFGCNQNNHRFLAEICWEFVATPPTNDDCAGAIAVGAGTTPFVLPEECPGPDITSCVSNDFNDIWYSYTATCDLAEVVFDTDGSSFDTGLSIWDACGGNEIDCDDDGGEGTRSLISLECGLLSGETVWIRISGFNGANGPGQLNITEACESPSCDDAVVATAGANNFEITESCTPVDITSCVFNDINDTWFEYTNNTNCNLTNLVFDTDGSAISDTGLSVWDACDGNEIACDDDGGAGFLSRIELTCVDPGETLFIRVSGYDGSTGSGVLNITETLDTEDPMFVGTLPADLNLTCSDMIPTAATLTATDNCTDPQAVVFAEVDDMGVCPASRILTRTWTATDGCNNEVTHTQVITIAPDTEAPTFSTCPTQADLVVSATCEVAIPDFVGTAVAMDNCANTVMVNQAPVAGTLVGKGSQVVTLTATDECNNSTSTCLVNFNVNDNIDPILTIPADATISCEDPLFEMATTTFVSDNFDSNTGWSTNTTGGNGNGEIIFSAGQVLMGEGVGAAGSSIVEICQTFSTVGFSNITLDLTAFQSNAGFEGADELIITYDTGGGTAVLLTDVEVWQGVDGQTGVNDGNTTPTSTGPLALPASANNGSVTICISVEVNSTNEDYFIDELTLIGEVNSPTTGMATATDNCNPPVITFTDMVVAGACPGESVITRTWSADDGCGNITTATQVITVVDTEAPVLVGVPAAMQINCEDAIPGDPGVTATDNCTDPQTVTFTPGTLVSAPNCSVGGTITHTWSADDGCGNITTETQVITVVDEEDPLILGCPNDLVINCGEADIETSISTWVGTSLASIGSMSTDNCGILLGVSDYVGVPPGFVCDQANGGLVVTFTILDNCENSATCTANVIIQDITPPAITCPTPNPLVLECGVYTEADVTTWLNLASGMDNCDMEVAITNNYTVGSLSNPCTDGSSPFELVVSFTATDNCGLTDMCTAIIRIEDNNTPTITCPAIDPLILECGNYTETDVTDWIATATATDACDQDVTITTDYVAGGLGNPCADGMSPFELAVNFAATDNCGLTDNCTSMIQVVDTEDPVILGCPDDLLLNCGEEDMMNTISVWIGTSLASIGSMSTDNCGINLGISDYVGIPPNFVCDPAAGGLLVTFRVEDACGNFATCTASIIIVDDLPPAITCPAPNPLILECGFYAESDVTNWLGLTSAIDQCNTDVTITNNYITGSLQDPCLTGTTPFELVVEFTATDDCNLTDNCSATIRVQDTQAPTITCPTPDPLILECGVYTNMDVTAWLGLASTADVCDMEVAITNDFVTGSLQKPCTDGSSPFELTVNFIATDNCGLTDMCTSLIRVVDTTAPSISCPSASLVLECGNYTEANVNTWLNSASGMDDCDTSVEITNDYVAGSLGNPCSGNMMPFELTVNFIATDNCGLIDNCAATIQVVDTNPPVITCPTPEPLILECGIYTETDVSDWLMLVTASDVCDLNLTITNDYVVGSLQDPCLTGMATFELTVNFTATDNCGLTDNCAAVIRVQDTQVPTITCPTVDPLIFECGVYEEADITAWLALATATDVCDTDVAITNNYITGSLQDPCLTGMAPFELTVNFTATDNCGLTDTCNAIIRVQDTQAPTITCPTPDPLMLECGIFAESEVTTWLNNASATDVCGSDVIITNNYLPGNLAGPCTGDNTPFELVVTFTATDNCGLTDECTRTIQVIDTSIPVITCPTPNPLILECGSYTEADVNTWLNLATATDECGGAPAVTNDYVTGSLGAPCADGSSPFELTVNFTATDNCGLTDNCSATIQIIDTNAPAITCATTVPLILECGVYTESDVSNWLALVTATDACDANVAIMNDYVTGSLQDPCLTGTAPFELIVNFTATDNCGLTNNCNATIRIQDTQAPSIVCPTPNLLILECGVYIESDISDWLSLATATDVCDTDVSIMNDYVTGSLQNPCLTGIAPFELTVNFTATDNCGLADNCIATIRVQDTQTPTIVCPSPDPISLECGDFIESEVTAWLNSATASDLCDTDVAITNDYLVGSLNTPCNGDNAPFELTVNFTATDNCGLTDNCTAIIQIIDTSNPVITCPTPDPLILECGIYTESDVTTWLGLATATDQCGGMPIVTNDYITGGLQDPCNGNQSSFELTVNFTATDNCGLSDNCSAIIRITDTTPPAIVCPTTDPLILECGVYAETDITNWLALTSATDQCDMDVAITNNYVVGSFGNPCADGTSPFQQVVTFTAIDNCGLMSMCNAAIQVVDTTDPIITCPTEMINLGCNPTLPTMADAISQVTTSDICGVQSVNAIPGVIVEDCASMQTFTVVVTDLCGNTNECDVVYFWSTDTSAPEFTCPTAPVDLACNPVALPTLADAEALVMSFDECGIMDVVATPNAITGDCMKTQIYNIVITDNCGNSGNCDITYIWSEDPTPPTLNCPTAISIDVDNSCETNSADVLAAIQGNAAYSASDNCDFNVDYNPVIADPITGGCATQNTQPTIDVTLVATDICDNTASCNLIITLNDLTPPTFTCPANIVLDCSDEVNDLTLTGDVLDEVDNCSDNLEATFTDSYVPVTNGFNITRTWTLIDACGNETSCDQLITVLSCGLEIVDPCSCYNNATVFNQNDGTGGDDGQFEEVVSITSMGGGAVGDPNLEFVVVSSTNAFDATGNPLVDNVTPLVYNAMTMTYDVTFFHNDAVGYTMSVQQVFDGVPGGEIFTVSNTCAYPSPLIQISERICNNDPAVDLIGIDQNGLGADQVIFTIDGIVSTVYDPATLSVGSHLIQMIWDGAADNTNGVATPGGISYPGCVQIVEYTTIIDAAEAPTVPSIEICQFEEAVMLAADCSTCPDMADAIVTWYSEITLTNVVATGSTFDPFASGDVNNTVPGMKTYYVTCTCGVVNACESEATPATLMVNPTVSLDFDGVTAESCPGAEDGTIIVGGFSGVPPYTINLYDGPTATGTPASTTIGENPTVFDGLVGGIYSVEVISTTVTGNACPAILEGIEVLNANPLTIDEVLVANEVCLNECDGSVTIIATSTEVLEYSIDGGSFDSNNIFTGLCAGMHSVTLRYANSANCAWVETFEILPGTEISEPIIVEVIACAGVPLANPLTATCDVDCDAVWYAEQNGGAPLFTGAEFDPIAIGLLNNNNTGTFTYWVDCECMSCGTSDRTPVNLVINANPDPVTIIGDLSVCPESTNDYSIENANAAIQYTWTVVGGTLVSSTGAQATITWGGDEENPTVSILEIDENGCETTSVISVTIETDQTIACKTTTTVSLDENCSSTIPVGIFVQSAAYDLSSYAIVSIVNDTSGIEIIPSLDGSITVTEKGAYTISVEHLCSGNVCWGTLIAEDNLKPILVCPPTKEVFCGGDMKPVWPDDYPVPMDNCCTDFPEESFTYTDSNVLPIGTEMVGFRGMFGSANWITTRAGGGAGTVTFGDDGESMSVMGDGIEDIEGGTQTTTTSSITFEVAGTVSFNFEYASTAPFGTEAGQVLLDSAGVLTALSGGVFNAQSGSITALDVAAGSTLLLDAISVVGQTGGTLTVTDFLFTTGEQITSDSADECGGMLLRTWTVVDCCGNESEACTQVVARIRPGVVNFPVDMELQCNNDNNPSTDPAETGYPTIEIDGVATEIQGKVCKYISSYADLEIQGNGLCDGSKKIIRTWTVFDWCTGEIHDIVDQFIDVMDNAAPVVTCEASITLSSNGFNCEADFTIPAPIVTDACSDNPTYSVYLEDGSEVSVGDVINVVGSTTITYIAIDDCGNGSDECTTTIFVEDTTAPVAICDQNTVVSIGTDGLGLICAATLDDGSYDNCADDLIILIKRMDAAPNVPFTDCVEFDCEDVGNDVQVRFRVFDGTGFGECMVTVNVQDAIGPEMTCPPNKDLNCGSDIYPNEVSPNEEDGFMTFYNGEMIGYYPATDNCGNIEITVVDEGSLDNCGEGVITRTWTAYNLNGGNSSSCVQLINVQKTVISTFTGDEIAGDDDDISWPAEVNLDCVDFQSDNAITDTENTGEPELIGEEDDCAQLLVGHTDQFLFNDPTACYKILRTWKVIDDCVYHAETNPNEGIWLHTQIIKVNDEVAPVFTCTDLIFYNDTDDGCFGEVQMTPSATDACDTQLSYTWEIDILNNGNVDFTGNTEVDGAYPTGTHSITWYAQDNCGNTGSCTHLFKVNDAKQPTPVCVVLYTALMPSSGTVDIWASDFDSGSSFDNCTSHDNLNFYVLDEDIDIPTPGSDISTLPTSIQFGCDNLGYQNVHLFVEDEFGNWDYCLTQVFVTDTQCVCPENPDCDPNAMLEIHGIVETEMSEKVEDVQVDISGMTTGIYTTGDDGLFTFFNVPMGTNGVVTPEKDIDYLNGVTTFDLVLISQHILGVQTLDSPYKIIAADANGSNSVTTLDLVKIQRVILNIDDDFAPNTSWRFVDTDYSFPQMDNPFAETFPEVISLANLSNDEMDADFIGVKIGDVNDSVIPNSMLGSQIRNMDGTLDFEILEQEMRSGNGYEIEVRSSNFNKMLGYQYTINIEGAEILEVIPGANTSDDNFGTTMLERGVITTSWHNATATSFDSNEILYTLRLKATTNTSVSKVISVSSNITKAESYTAEGELKDIAFNFTNGATTTSTAFELYQNRPNPFKEETVIGYSLPQADKAKITIMDVSGKVLKLIEQDAVQGYNEVILDKAGLQGAGVLYYRLETAANTATKKMTLIK